MEEAWEKVHKSKFGLMSREIRIDYGTVRRVPCYNLTKAECLYITTKFNHEALGKTTGRKFALCESRQRMIQIKKPRHPFGHQGSSLKNGGYLPPSVDIGDMAPLSGPQ